MLIKQQIIRRLPDKGGMGVAQSQIASFVVRFHLTDVDKESKKKNWRIKVTHVQKDEETLFETIEEATVFMKKIVGEA